MKGRLKSPPKAFEETKEIDFHNWAKRAGGTVFYWIIDGSCLSFESPPNPTPTATRPLHHTASVTHISPDRKQCGEDWH